MQRGCDVSDYATFISKKQQHGAGTGFAPIYTPKGMFDFQASLLEWHLLKGRSASLLDCGLGKT